MTQTTLLLITDDPQLRYLFTRYGEHNGCQVFCAKTIEKALLRSQRHPDLVFLHLLGADHDWERMRCLKAHPAIDGVPVTIISAVADEARARAEGVAHWLWQPVMYADFLAALEATAGRSQPRGLGDARGLAAGHLSTPT